MKSIALKEKEVVDLLIKLVKAKSYPGIPNQEAEVVEVLDRYLREQGIKASIIEVKDGRPNLIASLQGPNPGPHLLFCGHTDTVPPNLQGSDDQFSPKVAKGRLFGRGTADMKGALASMAVAMGILRDNDLLQKGKVSFAAVIDEEMASLGVEDLILKGFRADGAVVGEPTCNRIAIGHKGLEWLQIDFLGRAAHGGTPQSGINAISAAAHFIFLVEKELIPSFKKRKDPILGYPAINMGTISGGDQPSTVAAQCTLKLDRRWVSTETIEQVFYDIENLLERVRKERPGLKTKVSRVPGGMATMIHGPLTIDKRHPLVKAASKALRDCGMKRASYTVFPAWTDGALLSREAKIPTIIWGPGELNYAHSPQESIRLEEVIMAVKLYTLAALHFTGSE